MKKSQKKFHWKYVSLLLIGLVITSFIISEMRTRGPEILEGMGFFTHPEELCQHSITALSFENKKIIKNGPTWVLVTGDKTVNLKTLEPWIEKFCRSPFTEQQMKAHRKHQTLLEVSFVTGQKRKLKWIGGQRFLWGERTLKSSKIHLYLQDLRRILQEI